MLNVTLLQLHGVFLDNRGRDYSLSIKNVGEIVFTQPSPVFPIQLKMIKILQQYLLYKKIYLSRTNVYDGDWMVAQR